MRVVNLAECRELLVVLDALRAQVLSGSLTGIGLCTHDRAGHEVIMLAGSYLADPDSTLQIAMKLAWQAEAIEAQPLLIAAH